MMTLQVISSDQTLIHEIADFLLSEKLLANAMISEGVVYKTRDNLGNIVNSKRYILKGISKSLLFHTINKKLREKFKDNMPLLYSEPVILIDPEQTDIIIDRLIKA